MNENSNIPNYGQEPRQNYNINTSYDAPKRRFGKIGQIGAGIRNKFSSPVFATGALLLAGVAFAGIIIAAYPDSDDAMLDAPIVVGEDFAYKEIPSDAGGVDIPNRDTTVFSSMDDERMKESAPIENLLDEDDAPADKVEAFAREVDDSMSEESSAGIITSQSPAEAKSQRDVKITERVNIQEIGKAEEIASMPAQPPAQAPERKPDVPAVAKEEVAVISKIEAPKRPTTEYKAGENSETQEYVKAEIEKDSEVTKEADTEATPTPEPIGQQARFDNVVSEVTAAVEPAAGDATVDSAPAEASSASGGTHFVQLSSVKSMSGAEGEWDKLQKTFSSQLGGVSHRVKTADLGAKGTYYRIQAGPMDKDAANKMCDAIKAKKPGGCLVVR